MLLALILLVSALAFGFALSFLFDFLDDLLKQVSFAFLAGVLASAWVSLLLSWALGSLSWQVVAVTSAILLAAALFVVRKSKPSIKPLRFGKAEAFLLFLFLLLAVINWNGILADDGRGGLTATANVWGDYAFHFSLITSFAYGQNFPPQYPVLHGAPLAYPFLMDFSSSAFLVGGLSLRDSVLLPNLLVSFSLVFLAYFLALALTGNKAASCVAAAFFFLNGDLGFAYFFKDMLASGNAIAFVSALPAAYSHVPAAGIHFMNLVFSIFVPQRSAILGFAISLLFYWLLFRNLEKQNKKEILLAAVLLGSLPMVHGHSFIACSFIAGLLLLWKIFDERKIRREWVYAAAIVAALAVPQILWIKQQTGASFFGWQWGWMHQNSDSSAFDVAVFWVKNLGVPLFLAVIGWFFADKRLRRFAIPFGMLFLLCNFVRFQPQDWDTIKVLIHPFFVGCVLAGLTVVNIWKRGNAFKVLATVLIAASVLSGVLTMVWWLGDHPVLYPQRDLIVADWVRQNTPADSLFLTSDAHNHLVPTLAGRRVVLGYRGWLWTHGLDYSQQERDVAEMYRTAVCAIFRKYGVDYVFIGPQEVGLSIDYAKFENSPNFENVYDARLDTYRFRVFRVKC
ncbi:Uncharacterised protein [Candidatus Norongarragalina meridionalis]|nr:Uncharacterised protein [Candidatus Norongarragalina meridionalis]